MMESNVIEENKPYNKEYDTFFDSYNKMYENLENALCLFSEINLKGVSEYRAKILKNELLKRIGYKIHAEYGLCVDNFSLYNGENYIELENIKINLSNKTYEIILNDMASINDIKKVINIKYRLESVVKYIYRETSKYDKIVDNSLFENVKYSEYNKFKFLEIEKMESLYNMFIENSYDVRSLRKVKDLCSFDELIDYCDDLILIIETLLENVNKCVVSIENNIFYLKNKKWFNISNINNVRKKLCIIDNLKSKILENRYYLRRLLIELKLIVSNSNLNVKNFSSIKHFNSTLNFCKTLDKCEYRCSNIY